MSVDDVVMVLNGALWPHADAGEVACASPSAFLRAWGRPGAYTCGRTFGRDGISQWGAHVTRLRDSLAALAAAAPDDFARARLPATECDMEALVAPSVMLALSECAARGIEGTVDGASWVRRKKTNSSVSPPPTIPLPRSLGLESFHAFSLTTIESSLPGQNEREDPLASTVPMFNPSCPPLPGPPPGLTSDETKKTHSSKSLGGRVIPS